jgi:hypothetical protein
MEVQGAFKEVLDAEVMDLMALAVGVAVATDKAREKYGATELVQSLIPKELLTFLEDVEDAAYEFERLYR